VCNGQCASSAEAAAAHKAQKPQSLLKRDEKTKQDERELGEHVDQRQWDGETAKPGAASVKKKQQGHTKNSAGRVLG